MEEIKVVKLEKAFAVKVPFELKGDFRDAFPSAKWNSKEKHWEVGPRSGSKLDAWLKKMEGSAAWVNQVREQGRIKEAANLAKEAANLLAVQKDGMALQNIPGGLIGPGLRGRKSQQSEAVKLAAVQQNGLALQHILLTQEVQSEAVYLAAVRQNVEALAWIPRDQQSEAVRLAAAQQLDGAAKQK